jgi:hypothetical protein
MSFVTGLRLGRIASIMYLALDISGVGGSAIVGGARPLAYKCNAQAIAQPHCLLKLNS